MKDSRLSALLGVEAGQSAYAVGKDVSASGLAGLTKGGQLSASFGSSDSKYAATSDSSTYAGSTITGKNINLTATSGDLDITGSALNGTHVALWAKGNIALNADASQRHQ